MTWIDDLFQNVPRELDYAFSIDELYVLTSFYLLIVTFTLIILFLAFFRLRKIDSAGEGGQAFLRALLGLVLIPIGRIIDFLYRLQTGNTQAILVGNTNFFYVAGTLLFLVFYAFYSQNVINLSELMRKSTSGRL
ncbi:MAG: hypothetical protein ACFFCZ_27925 [Promethearchaeota archaeon]